MDDAYKESIIQLHANSDEIDRLKLRVDAREGKIRKMEKENEETVKTHEKLIKEMKEVKDKQEVEKLNFES